MCRSYVIEHDCGHLTFCKRPKWNDIAGNIIGFAIAIPYSMWKFVHNSHHKNVGNLSMRDFNPEVWTLTIAEYEEASLLKKTMYRFMRSRFNRLVLGPTLNIRQMLGVRVLAFAFAILFGHKLAQQTSFTYLL
jgi:omega-6 fatty acid desaturase (delta-12 desaturase)